MAKLAVGPGAPTPPPSPPAIPVAPVLISPADATTVTQPVTFDWNDVANAATYTTQVDEISAFGEPLIMSASVTTSAFTTGSLPAGDWFWRVRAVNSAGTPGPWSAVRAFTVQGAPIPPSPSPSGDRVAAHGGRPSHPADVVAGAGQQRHRPAGELVGGKEVRTQKLMDIAGH